MNQEKAKEHFSSYYEGTLEAGLSQAVGQALLRDSELKQAYRDFERTYDDLGSLKYETVEIPFDLRDRILARVDLQQFEQKRTAQPGWVAWMRNLAMAGVAGAAVIGAILAIRNGDSDVSGAGGLVVQPKEHITVAIEEGTPVVHYRPSSPKTVLVREGDNLRRVTLDGDSLRSALRNEGPEATIVSYQVAGEAQHTLVALPGTETRLAPEGQGSMADFVKALAEHFRTPVFAQLQNPTVPLVWRFEGTDPVAAASSVLDTQRYSVERRQSGMLVLMEQ